MDKLTLDNYLRIADLVLPEALNRYQKIFNRSLAFLESSKLTHTPEKAYSAKAHVQVIPIKGSSKTMNLIAFSSGDGTGDNSLYSAQNLIVPPEYQFDEKPERVFPRSKEGIIMEAFFPLFSISDDNVYDNATCLEELTTIETEDKFKLRSLGWLGQFPKLYRAILAGQASINPQIGLTKGYRRNGERFGDPHSIHYSKSECNQSALQIVGFLGLTKDDTYLMEKVDEVAYHHSEY